MTSERIAVATPHEEGRLSALAGRPVFVNPHIGGEAEDWFRGYRSVPEAEIGSQPALRASFITTHRRKKAPRGKSISMADAGVNALGDNALPGSTPKPRAGWQSFAPPSKNELERTPRPWAEGALS